MITVGARGSQLSQIQTSQLVDWLKEMGLKVETVYSKSIGDTNRITPIHQIGEDGVFTSHLEGLLVEGKIDLAVHSMKDLPTKTDNRLVTIPVLPREDPRDVLLIWGKYGGIDELPPQSVIATSSVRRRSQLLAQREDLVVVDIRGNIDTRVGKLIDGWFDGLVISKAAINRYPQKLPLGISSIILPLTLFPTSPAQGQLAVQLRKGDRELTPVIEKLRSADSGSVALEREVFSRFGSGCITPVGVTVQRMESGITLDLFDGRRRGTNRYMHIIGKLESEVLRLVDEYFTPHISTSNPPISEFNLIITKGEDHPMVRKIQDRGVPTYCLPIVASIPVLPETCAVDSIVGGDWVILTSPRGVHHLPKTIVPLLQKKKIAVIGSTTARAAQSRGIPVHYVSSQSSSTALVRELHEKGNPKTIIHIGSNTPPKGLINICDSLGVALERVVVYSTTYELPSSLTNTLLTQVKGNDREWVVVSTSTKITEILLSSYLGDLLRDQRWIVYSERSRSILVNSGVVFSDVTVCEPNNVNEIMEIMS